jgi:hypothetical protein
MTEVHNVVEISSGASDADRDAESREADALASRSGPATSGSRELVNSVHLAATLLGLGVPSSRLWWQCTRSRAPEE